MLLRAVCSFKKLVQLSSWGLNSKITSIIGQTDNVIYRVWVKGKSELPKLSDIIYKNADSYNFHLYKRVYMAQHSDVPYFIEDQFTKVETDLTEEFRS